MRLRRIVEWASDKERFTSIENYIEFCKAFLDFARASNIQADIVSKNEPTYHFLQYKAEGNFNVSRPLNYNLRYRIEDEAQFAKDFLQIMGAVRTPGIDNKDNRKIVNRTVYTLQQAIGATLDALPAGSSNKTRKINGDLFERLICLMLNRLGINCSSGVVKVPVRVDGQEEFTMCYQHDLIVREGQLVKIIGSVKTSSKDRLDKIFIDKFLFCKLTGGCIPHVAIFLNDVQRKGNNPRNYGVDSTFLPGHFKGYTVKLNPLDGVYYCDIRPSMVTSPIIRDHIRTFDAFIFDELWKFLRRRAVVATIAQVETP